MKILKKSLSLALIAAFLILIIAGVGIYFFVFHNLPSAASLKDYKQVPVSSQIFDRNGKLLYAVFKDQNRTPIKLKSVPPYVYQATIAIEDKDFYKHGGISIFGGMLRAVKDMVLRKGGLQGGSTLTQQLVKSALLTQDRTLQRKAKEIVLALQAEQLFTKDEILELYLNQVPYGGSAYGIEQAAKTYFGKSANKLSVAEAALLAGLPQAPSYYSPYNDPDLAITRRNEVINQMFEQGYIDRHTRDTALKAKPFINPLKTEIHAPHFVFYVKNELEKKYGKELVEEGGLKITTSLDLKIQEQAEKILAEELEDIKYLNVSNGAVLVTRPPTGEILAMLGSVDYFATGSGAFNVTTALRQPGSSIKPLNYAVGLDRGLVTPASIFLDTATCFSAPGQPTKYCPVNYDGTFHGPVSLRASLGNSFNIPAVKMLAMNGVENFVASSSAFLITSFTDPTRYGLSLTLGGGEVRMTEMAQAFSAFANAGKPKYLQPILKIEDKNGKVLYKLEDLNFRKDIEQPLKYPNTLAITGNSAIKPETAFLISHILADNGARVQAFGPSSQLVIPRKTVSVKTGTTDDKKDNWTIGYTPNFLTVVWVGNNDNTPMNRYLASGITGAAPIWNRVMKVVLKDQPDLPPRKPDNVIGAKVCNDTGTVAGKNPDGGDNCPTHFEYITKGTENLRGLSIRREVVNVTRDTDKLVAPNTPDTDIKEKTIMYDGVTRYCLDCAGDAPPTPTPSPQP